MAVLPMSHWQRLMRHGLVSALMRVLPPPLRDSPLIFSNPEYGLSEQSNLARQRMAIGESATSIPRMALPSPMQTETSSISMSANMTVRHTLSIFFRSVSNALRTQADFSLYFFTLIYPS